MHGLPSNNVSTPDTWADTVGQQMQYFSAKNSVLLGTDDTHLSK